MGISSYPQINPFEAEALFTRMTSSVAKWIYNEAEINGKGRQGKGSKKGGIIQSPVAKLVGLKKVLF